MKIYMMSLTGVLMIGWAVLTSCNNSGIRTSQLQDPVIIESANTHVSGSPQSDAALKKKASDDLISAFKGETTASAKYAAYAKKAEQEGFHTIAVLFKAASVAENIHATNHKAVLQEFGIKNLVVKPEFTVKSTKENLEDAVKGETYEVTVMYPEFLKDADAASDQLALISLNYAYKTELKHKAFFDSALTALGTNTFKNLPAEYYVCPTCGNTYDKLSVKRCGICMTDAEKFIRINNL